MDRDAQRLVGEWVNSTGEIPVGYQEGQIFQEVDEFRHEWENGRDPERLAGELGDIGIALLGVAEGHGIDLLAVMMAKMAQVYLKYPPHVLQELQQQEEMSRAEAFAYMKDLWQKNHPREEDEEHE